MVNVPLAKFDHGFGLYLSRGRMINVLSQYQPLDGVLAALRAAQSKDGEYAGYLESCEAALSIVRGAIQRLMSPKRDQSFLGAKDTTGTLGREGETKEGA